MSGHTHVCIICWRRMNVTRDWKRNGAFITTVPNAHNRMYHADAEGEESQGRLDESSQELLAVGHKSTRVQRAANRRKRHLRKKRALYVSAGAQPALSSGGGMSVRVRRCGRGTRQSHCSLGLL